MVVARKYTGDDDEGENGCDGGGGGVDALGRNECGGLGEIDLQGGVDHLCGGRVLPNRSPQGRTEQRGPERVLEPTGVFQHTRGLSGGSHRPAVARRGRRHLQHAAPADLCS